METLRLFVVEVSYCRSSNLVRISDIILSRPAGIFVMTADVIAVGPGRGGTASAVHTISLWASFFCKAAGGKHVLGFVYSKY